MTVRNVTPMVTVRDLDATVTFMTDILGFTVGSRMDGYAFCHHGGPTNAGIRLLAARPEHDQESLDVECLIYVDVDNVDAFYNDNKAAFDALPKSQFRTPFDQPYNQRELHVSHGNLLFLVGHGI